MEWEHLSDSLEILFHKKGTTMKIFLSIPFVTSQKKSTVLFYTVWHFSVKNWEMGERSQNSQRFTVSNFHCTLQTISITFALILINNGARHRKVTIATACQVYMGYFLFL